MSQTQISFAAFAQRSACPPAGENEAEPGLAAPSASGQQAGTPLPYEGVFKPFRGVIHGDSRFRGGRRKDMLDDWQFRGGMDAPDYLASGSHVCFAVSLGYVLADGYGVHRELA